MSLELNHTNSVEQPIRYDAGTGEPAFGEAKRVWVQNLPSEWIVMTRDLYEEFGEIDITGLTLSAVDGAEYALFDHIYLARSPNHFDQIPALSTAEAVNQHARQTLAQGLIDRVLPAAVVIQTPDDRWGAGIMIDGEGSILTAGHLVVHSGAEVTVHFHNADQQSGVVRGVNREMDAAIVQVQAERDFSFVEISHAEAISSNDTYLGVFYQVSSEHVTKPAARVNRSSPCVARGYLDQLRSP